MTVTDVQITLVPKPDSKLLAFATIVIDYCFLIRDIKIIQGSQFLFIAMPSRKLVDRCGACGAKNHLLAKYCNQCGGQLSRKELSREKQEKLKLHADIAHPINMKCRQGLQKLILKAYHEELARSRQPGYVRHNFDEDASLKYDDGPLATPLQGMPMVVGGPPASPAGSKTRANISAESAFENITRGESAAYVHEREIAIKLLHMINSSDNTSELMQNVVGFLKEQLNFEAVGVRLGQAGDFPYFTTSGFPDEFINAEKKLCVVDAQGESLRDDQGRPKLACLCGKVICGQADPTQACYTARGSFWTNSNSEFYARAAEAEKLNLRQSCFRGGYESMALVPLWAGGNIIGLLQFCDRRPERFTPALISFLENLAENLAIFLAQRKAENALSETERLLAAEKAANSAKDVFIAMLSHELRVPLSSILVWVKMLLSQRLDETIAAKGLKVIERNAKAQNQLIDDLLDISRIVTGKLKLRLHPIELRPVVEAALDAVCPMAEAKGVQIHSHFNPAPIYVSGDPIRLQQVVWNLLTNAIKFTSKGGRVDLRVERTAGSDPETALVQVADNGIGIQADFLPHIFDRFRQANDSGSRAYTGLGLGLTIIRYLVQVHHGSVAVESAGQNQGATFSVTLPTITAPLTQNLKYAPVCKKAAREPFNCPVPLNGLRIMVVDDDQDALDWLSFILQQCGAEVQVVTSAAEALKEFESRPPTILISDIGMPHEDGYSLIRRVRRLEKSRGGDVPALALTAYIRDEDRIMAINAGFQTHLPKPTDPLELVEAIAGLAGCASKA